MKEWAQKLYRNMAFVSIILMFTGFCLGATAKEDFSIRFFWGIGFIVIAGILALLFVPNN